MWNRMCLMKSGAGLADVAGLVQPFHRVEDNGNHEVGHHADHTGHHEDDHRLHRRRHFFKGATQVFRTTVRRAAQGTRQIARVLAQTHHFNHIDREQAGSFKRA